MINEKHPDFIEAVDYKYFEQGFYVVAAYIASHAEDFNAWVNQHAPEHAKQAFRVVCHQLHEFDKAESTVRLGQKLVPKDLSIFFEIVASTNRMANQPIVQNLDN